MQHVKLVSGLGLFLLAFGISHIQAQDIVYSRGGHKFEAKVSKITTNKVYFRKHGVATGPTYEALTTYVYRIEYENGTVDTFDEEGVITINDTKSRVIPVEELKEIKEINKEQFSYSTEYGRTIISAKAHINNREATTDGGWQAIFPLFDGSFVNYGGSFEHISPNGLCSFEIPFFVGYTNRKSQDLKAEDFKEDHMTVGASPNEGKYQIANYQQVALRFKMYPTGQEQISYFIGPFITGSRGEFQYYSQDHFSSDFTNYIYDLEKVTYTSMSVGLHNGMTINPGKFVTFTLGGGLGIQLVNTGEATYEKAASYYIDFGLGIRL